VAPQDTAMEPRPNPRWPRGTCFAWELLRGCRKGSMLDGSGPLLCIEVEEPGGPHESGGIWRAVSARATVGVAEDEQLVLLGYLFLIS
jgi:hypothetical protein